MIARKSALAMRAAAVDAGTSTADITWRYSDPCFDAVAVKVFPGEHYVTTAPHEMLVTVLGSCVSACIHDPVAGVGGMNHFMLPESAGPGRESVSASMRYGNVAMERLINDILKRGGARERLEIKVFGGGNVMSGGSNIGHLNAEFVEQYLFTENLPIAAHHMRGNLPRRVHYFPVVGKVLVLELKRTEKETVVLDEVAYETKIRTEPVAGSVELF